MARRTKRFEEAQETKISEQLRLLLVVVGSNDEAEIQREKTRARGFCDATSGAACACRGTSFGVIYQSRLKMLDKINTISQMGCVGASAGEVLQRER